MFESLVEAEALTRALGTNHFSAVSNATSVGQAEIRHRLGAFEMLLPENITWSPAVFDIYGLPMAHQRLGLEALLLPLFPEDGARVGRLLKNSILHQVGFHAIVRLIRPDLEVRLVEIYADVLTAASRTIGLAGTVEDLTEQMRAGETVGGRFDFITGMAGAVALVDAHLRLLACSDLFLRCFRLESRSGVIGQNLARLTEKASLSWDADHDRAMRGSVIRSTRDFFEGTTGRKLTCPVHFAPWSDDGGNVVRVIISIASLASSSQSGPRSNFKAA